MKRIFGIILLFILPGWLLAQAIVIRGVVMDSASRAVEGVSIRLLGGDSLLVKGTVSDEEGSFIFQQIRPGSYRLVISHVGYAVEELFLPDCYKSVDLKSIVLSGKVNELNTAEVRAMPVGKEGERLYYPSVLQKKHSANGFGLLDNLNIPELDVDVGGYKVSSVHGSVALCINGREVTANELRALPPGEVMRVEYNNMAEERHGNKNLSVNFITIPREYGGYMGLGADQYLIQGNYMLNLKFFRKKSEFMLLYAPSYINDPKQYANTHESFFLSNGELMRYETGIPATIRKQTHDLSLLYRYRTSKQELNLIAQHLSSNSPEDELLARQVYYPGEYPAVILNQKITDRSYKNYFRVEYSLSLGKKHSLLLKASALQEEDNYNRLYDEYADFKNKQHIMYSLHNNVWDTYVSGLYSWQLKPRHKLSLSSQYYQYQSRLNYNNGINRPEEKIFQKGGNTLNYFYNSPKIVLRIHIGSSIEGVELKNQDKTKVNSWNGSFILRYVSSPKHIFDYKLLMSERAPVFNAYTTINQEIDGSQSFRGNPDLKYRRYWGQTLSYTHTRKKSTYQASLNYVTNCPANFYEVIREDGHFIHTYSDVYDYNNFFAVADVTYYILDKYLILRGRGVYRRVFIERENRNENRYSGQLKVNYMHRNWMFMARLMSAFKKQDEDGYFRGSDMLYGFEISYNNKNLSLTAGTENPFNDYYVTEDFSNGVYRKSMDTFSHLKSRMYYLRASWNFSFGKKHKFTEPEWQPENEYGTKKVRK